MPPPHHRHGSIVEQASSMLVVRWVNQVMSFVMSFARLALFAVKPRWTLAFQSPTCSQGQSQPKTPPVTQP